MKFRITIILLIASCYFLRAHDVHSGQSGVRAWHLLKEKATINASFYMLRNDTVFLEQEHHGLVKTPVGNLSEADRLFVKIKDGNIQKINHPGFQSRPHVLMPVRTVAFVLLAGAALLFLAMAIARRRRPDFSTMLTAVTVLAGLFLLAGSTYIFRAPMTFLGTDPDFIDAAFVPFRPHVHTFYDQDYFYVESKGIPATHKMMTGISDHGWQQQVPIPQCYTATNAWPIPLNPVMSPNPVPVDQIHFTRGAIAIAANGVPIFNPHTNTGVDAYLDGQLDNFGGHCGRADDYHYHTAPLHLYNHTSALLPVAFALDGFPVYGLTEPDGTPMQPLDSNHGHALTGIANGIYHYHGSTSAPYMIARFAGQVTEDNTHQLVPQAKAKPVRASRKPLSGALIKTCEPNANNNGYTLVYTLNGKTDSIVYSWTQNGIFTFRYYLNGNGTSLDSVYNGSPVCQVPTLQHNATYEAAMELCPNPVSDHLEITVPSGVNSGRILVFDMKGQFVFGKSFSGPADTRIETASLAKGTYVLMMIPDSGKVRTARFLKNE